MDIRKLVLGGLVASTAVALPVSAASAALAAPAVLPPPHAASCTPPPPPAPPRHHQHDGDHIKLTGGGQQGGGNKYEVPPPPPAGEHKPGSCTCKPGGQAPPPFYSIFEPPSLFALYETEPWSYTWPPGKGVKPGWGSLADRHGRPAPVQGVNC